MKNENWRYYFTPSVKEVSLWKFQVHSIAMKLMGFCILKFVRDGVGVGYIDRSVWPHAKHSMSENNFFQVAFLNDSAMNFQ